MMFGPSVKIDKEMWRRIEQSAAKAGYSSPEEFVRDAWGTKCSGWKRRK